MGGVPSRETLTRRLVRIPSYGQRHQIVLIPLIKDFFPSPDCPLFEQLYTARCDPAVRYNSTGEDDVHQKWLSTRVPALSVTRKELYDVYITNCAETFLFETDEELANAYRRKAYPVDIVPCAIAFLYDAPSSPQRGSSQPPTSVGSCVEAWRQQRSDDTGPWDGAEPSHPVLEEAADGSSSVPEGCVEVLGCFVRIAGLTSDVSRFPLKSPASEGHKWGTEKAASLDGAGSTPQTFEPVEVLNAEDLPPWTWVMYLTKSAGDHNSIHSLLAALHMYADQWFHLACANGITEVAHHPPLRPVAYVVRRSNIPVLCFMREVRVVQRILNIYDDSAMFWLDESHPDAALVRGIDTAAGQRRVLEGVYKFICSTESPEVKAMRLASRTEAAADPKGPAKRITGDVLVMEWPVGGTVLFKRRPYLTAWTVAPNEACIASAVAALRPYLRERADGLRGGEVIMLRPGTPLDCADGAERTEMTCDKGEDDGVTQLAAEPRAEAGATDDDVEMEWVRAHLTVEVLGIEELLLCEIRDECRRAREADRAHTQWVRLTPEEAQEERKRVLPEPLPTDGVAAAPSNPLCAGATPPEHHLSLGCIPAVGDDVDLQRHAGANGTNDDDDDELLPVASDKGYCLWRISICGGIAERVVGVAPYFLKTQTRRKGKKNKRKKVLTSYRDPYHPPKVQVPPAAVKVADAKVRSPPTNGSGAGRSAGVSLEAQAPPVRPLLKSQPHPKPQTQSLQFPLFGPRRPSTGSVVKELARRPSEEQTLQSLQQSQGLGSAGSATQLLAQARPPFHLSHNSTVQLSSESIPGAPTGFSALSGNALSSRESAYVSMMAGRHSEMSAIGPGRGLAPPAARFDGVYAGGPQRPQMYGPGVGVLRLAPVTTTNVELSFNGCRPPPEVGVRQWAAAPVLPPDQHGHPRTAPRMDLAMQLNPPLVPLPRRQFNDSDRSSSRPSAPPSPGSHAGSTSHPVAHPMRMRELDQMASEISLNGDAGATPHHEHHLAARNSPFGRQDLPARSTSRLIPVLPLTSLVHQLRQLPSAKSLPNSPPVHHRRFPSDPQVHIHDPYRYGDDPWASTPGNNSGVNPPDPLSASCGSLYVTPCVAEVPPAANHTRSRAEEQVPCASRDTTSPEYSRTPDSGSLPTSQSHRRSSAGLLGVSTDGLRNQPSCYYLQGDTSLPVYDASTPNFQWNGGHVPQPLIGACLIGSLRFHSPSPSQQSQHGQYSPSQAPFAPLLATFAPSPTSQCYSLSDLNGFPESQGRSARGHGVSQSAVIEGHSERSLSTTLPLQIDPEAGGGTPTNVQVTLRFGRTQAYRGPAHLNESMDSLSLPPSPS